MDRLGLPLSLPLQDLQGTVHDLATEFCQFADAIVLRAINRCQIFPVDFDDWTEGDGGLPPLVRAMLTAEYQKRW